MNLMRNILSGVGLCLALQAGAQQLPVMNHYLYNPYLYNPARTGDSGMGSLNLNFKRQWTSMPYAPITGALSLEAPIANANMGVGAMIYSDHTHIINRVGGMGTYAYHIPFSKTYPHRLSAGISLGVIHQSFDFAAASVENPNDPQLLNSQARGTSFDFSAGLNYRWKDLNVGLSMLQGLNNQIRFLNALSQEVKYVNSRHFLAMASYDFYLGPKKDFMVRPAVMTRIIAGLPLQVEGNVAMNWRRIVWLGLGYRSSNNETSTAALVGTIGVEMKKSIFIAYTFEFAADATLNNSLGTQHEFMMAYRFGKNEAKEKEMLNMREEIERLKLNDKILSDRIDQNTRNIDTLMVNTKRIEENTTRIDEKINELEKTTGKNNQANEEMRKQMQDQQDQLNAQQAAINQHRKEIDELREAIKKQPLKYKKLGDINFGNASAELSAVEKSKMDALKATLLGMPSAKIYLYGNASTDGDPGKNMELSVKRCIAVRKYLVSLGIPGERIEVLPMGQDNTITGTAAVNAADRRVDIMVTE